MYTSSRNADTRYQLPSSNDRNHQQSHHHVNSNGHYGRRYSEMVTAAEEPIYSGFVNYPSGYSNHIIADNTSSYMSNNPLPLPPRSSYYHHPSGHGHGQQQRHHHQRASFSHPSAPSSVYHLDNNLTATLINSNNTLVVNVDNDQFNQMPPPPTLKRRSQQRNYSLPGVGHASYYSSSQQHQQPVYSDAIYSNGQSSTIIQPVIENIYSNSGNNHDNHGYNNYYPSQNSWIRDPIYGNLPPPPSQFQNSPKLSLPSSSVAPSSASSAFNPSSAAPLKTKRMAPQPMAAINQPVYGYVTKSQPSTPGRPLTANRRSSYTTATISQPGTPYINPLTSGHRHQSLTITSNSTTNMAQPLLVQRTPSNDRISTSPSTSSTSAGSVTNRGASISCPPPIKRVQSGGQLLASTSSSNNRSVSSASQRKESIEDSQKSINKSAAQLVSQLVINGDTNNITTIKRSERQSTSFVGDNPHRNYDANIRRSISRSSFVDDGDGGEDNSEDADDERDDNNFRLSFKDKSRSRDKNKNRNETIILPKDDNDRDNNDKYNAKLINDKKSASGSKDAKDKRKPRRVLFAIDSNRSEISCLMKYLIFGINFIVMVIGLAMTSIGFWAWKEKDYGISNLNLDPAFALILFGLLCAVIGGVGSFGALRENTTLLGGYAICLTVLLVIELMGGILAFIFKDWIKSQATIGFQAFIVYYRDDPDRQNLVDWIQESWLECCGLEGPKDWDMNIYFNCSSEAKGSREACGVPFSCCKSDNTDDSIFRNNQCGYDVRKPEFMGDKSLIIYEKGCLRSGEEWIESNLVSISVATVIISIFQKNAMSRINQVGCNYAVSLWIKRRLIKIVLIFLFVPFVEILGICFAQNLRADIFSQKSKWR